MPSGKEIRTKIKSVQNTRKITKAMEMVAASKMRKAQERMKAARPYGDNIRRIAANLSHAHSEYRHPVITRRDQVNNAGLIVITTDVPALATSERGAALSKRGADGSGERAGRPRASVTDLGSITDPAAGSGVRIARGTASARAVSGLSR